MKLSVTQANLNKALTTVSRVVSTRNNLPILSNVLLNTTSSRLKISATNLELGITYFIGCKVEEEGAVTVPARLITSLVSNLANDKIQLISEKDNLHIKSINASSLVNGNSPDDFPEVPTVSSKSKFGIDSKQLLQLLSQVLTSASSDESRPVLAGIYLAQEGDTLIMAATDSYRLSEVKVKTKLNLASPIIIPLRSALEIVRILGSFEGEVTVVVSKTEAMFSFGDIELVSRLIDGKFPSYNQIIPAKHTTTIELSRGELIHAVKVANLFAREGANTIRLESSKNNLKILSSATSVGENTSTIDIKSSGENAEIALNARYLSDALSTIESEQVSLKINGKLDPCLIEPDPVQANPSVIHLIMPLRS